MKAIYEMNFDCGRMGCLNGLFIAEKVELEATIGKTIYFGEVLGKHSDIYGPLEASEITMKSDDQDFIAQVEQVIGEGTLSGYNPLDYCGDDEDYED